jgi:very-short-patch-repair endonuclease
VISEGRTIATRAPPGRVGRSRHVATAARIAVIAGRQHGMITRRQLVANVGLKVGAVNYRVKTGELVVVHRGVYSVAGHQDPHGWAMAAALAGGPGAVVSGRSAAAVHGIWSRGGHLEITAPRERRHPAIRCRMARLSLGDVTVHLGIPVTTLARTVFDIAGRGDSAGIRLAGLVNRARLVSPSLLEDVDALIARSTGRGYSGLAESRMRPFLDDRNGPVRSVFEARFRRALDASDLPTARFNVVVGGFEVDVLWPEAKLVVELDGRAYHTGENAFERDRDRDARLAALHHEVIRVTWRRWQDHPRAELDRLADVIRVRTAIAKLVDRLDIGAEKHDEYRVGRPES